MLKTVYLDAMPEEMMILVKQPDGEKLLIVGTKKESQPTANELAYNFKQD